MSAPIPTRDAAIRFPTGRALLVFGAAAAVVGVAWLGAVLAVPAATRTFVAWAGGITAITLCFAIALVAYAAELARQTRDELAQIDAEATRLRYDLARLSEDTLPAVVTRLHEGASVQAALADVARPADGTVQRLLYTVAEEVASGKRMSATAMAACANAAARVQAQTTRVLAEMRVLEDRHSEDKIFADLLELDHHVAQIGRLADSIVLLSGGRSGRRWTKPIAMESILRGAMGRIDAYRRIHLHSTSDVSVVGYAAEGVMHALAELMDNAATFSAQHSAVHVYVEEEDAGVLVTIEDAGLGMRNRERRRAERAVSEALNLTTLPGTRLGLAVVGRLASKHGFTVNFRPSARGGTGVVVMIPRQLLTQRRQDPVPHAPAPAVAATPAVPALSGPTGDELPKRRRGETLAAASRSSSLPPSERTRDSRDAPARFAAFRQASGRTWAHDTPARPAVRDEDGR